MMDEKTLQKVERKISFIKDDDLAPIPENSTLSKESTMFIEYASNSDVANGQDEFMTVPPHVAALYEYFGRTAAEDFLHPKMEAGGAGGTKSTVDIAVKRERTNLSQMSNSTDVESLWSNLRADSQTRLIRRDARINDRLKKAYNAFARQCLARHERPPERNFAPSDDLRELSQLIADSQIEQVHDRRRKKELMFRLAHVHENQYRILEHNNPLPDLVNHAGDDSVASYIPSWSTDLEARDNVEEEESVVETERRVAPAKPRRNKPSLGELSFEAANKWRPPSQRSGTRYHFLNDQEYKGAFSARIREQFAAQNDPIEAMLKQANARREESERRSARRHVADGQLLPGFALRRRSAHLGNLSELQQGSSLPRIQRHGRSAPCDGQSYARNRDIVIWEPLSLGALLDYKKVRQLPLSSAKPFRSGATPWWGVEEAHP